MSDVNSHESEDRFYIQSDATRVTVTFTDDGGQAHQVVGQLIDLAPTGVRIDVNGRLEPGQRVDLKIEIPAESITIDSPAVVCWQQPRTAREWSTGCKLTDPFDFAAIERLATARVLNRRRDPRYDVDRPVQVRTELSHTTHDARLVNYSKGGFCLLFDQPVEFPHERLMLLVKPDEKQVTIPARVMWAGEVRDAYGVGCSFSNMDGFISLRDYAEPKGARRRSRLRPRSTKFSFWIALSMVVTIGLQTCWIVQSQLQVGVVIRNGWTAWVVEPIRERFLSSDQESPDVDDGRAASQRPSDRTDEFRRARASAGTRINWPLPG